MYFNLLVICRPYRLVSKSSQGRYDSCVFANYLPKDTASIHILPHVHNVSNTKKPIDLENKFYVLYYMYSCVALQKRSNSSLLLYIVDTTYPCVVVCQTIDWCIHNFLAKAESNNGVMSYNR